jgi:hypothetical protein
MKKNLKFLITVKHDKGKFYFHAYALNEEEAIEKVMESEGCPRSAILKIVQFHWYVTMTDKFMSGWGMADGKTNKLIIQCDTYEEAKTIERNAKQRSEMKYINIRFSKPKYGKHILESWKTYDELGDIWKK